MFQIKAKQTCTLITASLCFLAGKLLVAESVLQVDYTDFLSRQDLIYADLTENWDEGAFIGNGLLGAMIYRWDEQTVRIEVGRTDVVDHRNEFGLQYDKFRLPIGQFLIRSKEAIGPIEGRLDIHKALFQAEARTGNQKLAFSSYTHAQYDVIILEVDRSGAEYELVWQPEVSASPRYYRQNKLAGFAPETYQPNPDPQRFSKDGIQFSYQPLLAGGGYCVAWKKVATEKVDRYYITIANSHPQDISVRQARQNLQLVTAQPIQDLWKQHTNWWNAFYHKCFISVPDSRFESFWWIQQYKMGSGTRADAPALDLLGPWYRHTPWAAYWFNLNVQLTYSPFYSSNRLDLALSMINLIDNNRQQLIRNAPEKYRHDSAALGRNASFDMAASIDLENPAYPDTPENSHLPGSMKRGETRSELGNLTWMLHNYWMHAAYSGDESMLRDLFPLLKRSINYYLHIIEEAADGTLHLPVTYSPEYLGGFTRDCNYDLALLRWGCQTLLEINQDLKIHDPLVTRWDWVLKNLTDYPKDENGFRIGRDVAFAQSHRHYSHLLMWHPLHILPDTPANRLLMLTSIDHWLNFDEALQGYSFTGSSSMLAKMGDGNRARDYMETFLTRFLRPNTMYMEAGPVMETPMAAVTSINEMLLQSWGGKIRIFPAVPDAWNDASFDQLRTEGGFLVSAVREDGRTSIVRIEATVDGSANLVIDGDPDVWEWTHASGSRIAPDGSHFNLNLAAGESVYFQLKNQGIKTIKAVRSVFGSDNPYGYKE